MTTFYLRPKGKTLWPRLDLKVREIIQHMLSGRQNYWTNFLLNLFSSVKSLLRITINLGEKPQDVYEFTHLGVLIDSQLSINNKTSQKQSWEFSRNEFGSFIYPPRFDYDLKLQSFFINAMIVPHIQTVWLPGLSHEAIRMQTGLEGFRSFIKILKHIKTWVLTYLIKFCPVLI